MTKIPVGATIAQAYRFAFGKFFTILGIVWLPWAIMAAVGFLLIRQAVAFSAAVTTHNLAGIGPLMLVLLPLYLLMMLLLCMQMVGITEHLLGQRKGSRHFYFSLGRPLWRFVGALLLVIVIILGVYLAMLAAGVILGIAAALLAKSMHSSAIMSAIFSIVASILLIAIFCTYIYGIVRLTFLLAPTVIAEHKIDLKRVWALGRGNFWRMFVILLAILIPAIIVEIVFMFGFLFHGLPPMLPPHATPDQISATQAAMAAWNAGMVSRMTGDWYITYPFFIVFTVLFYGLSAGAQVFAYRALVPESAPRAG